MDAVSRGKGTKRIKKKNKAEAKKDFLSRKVMLLIYIPVLFLSFLNIYNSVFDKKINLGGDNAMYYILGQSLADGNGFTNVHTQEMQPHSHFPPGYPVIIAFVSKVFSDDILFIKRVNGFLFAASIGLLFLIVYQFTGNYHIPFITCLLTLLNVHLLKYSFIMMSEIPFLCFSLLSILLAMRLKFEQPFYKNGMFYALLLSLSFTYFIRSSGVAVLAGVMLFFAYRRQWGYLISLVVGFVLLALPWYIRVKSLNANSYLDQLVQKNPYRPEDGLMQFTDWFERIWTNFERYVTREIPSGIFNFIEVTSYQDPITTKEWVIGAVTVLVLLYGLIRLKKYQVFIASYVGATFGILLIWPDVWFGVRFLLPLVPILIFLIVYAVTDLFTLADQYLFKKKRPTAVAFTVVLLGLFYVQVDGKKVVNDLEAAANGFHAQSYRNYFEMAQWLNVNAPDTTVTACRKGSMFYLYSQQPVTGYKYTLDAEEQIEYLKSNSTDYVVVEQLGYSSTKRYLVPAIQKYPAKFQMVKHLKDPDTYLMRFRPNIGYSGEFQNDQRNGYGTFLWEDGNRFEGQWKDNQRNGQGVLYVNDGRVIEGTWKNDTLHGEVTIKTRQGELMKKSRFEMGEEVEVLETSEDRKTQAARAVE